MSFQPVWRGRVGLCAVCSSCSAHLRTVCWRLEATGHYWRNLFVALLAKGYAVAVLNPLRTRRFAEEELQRTKTDAIDALGIARFAAQKRPPAAQLPDVATEELRELSRLRERLAGGLCEPSEAVTSSG